MILLRSYCNHEPEVGMGITFQKGSMGFCTTHSGQIELIQYLHPIIIAKLSSTLGVLHQGSCPESLASQDTRSSSG